MRELALVGELREAKAWMGATDRFVTYAYLVTGAKGLWGLRAKSLHLVLLPSYWHLPHHLLLRTGVWVLHKLGATVERA